MRRPLHGPQTEIPREWIEIPFAMQQDVAAFDAPRRNQRVDRLADRHSQAAKLAVVSGGLNRDLLSGQFHHGEGRQQAPGVMELPVVVVALKKELGTR